MKIIKFYSKIHYSLLSFLFGFGSIFYWFAKLEHKTYPRLPYHSHWTDRYFIWCEYLIDKARGKNVNFEEMKFKEIKKFREELKKISKKMNERDMSGLIG